MATRQADTGNQGQLTAPTSRLLKFPSLPTHGTLLLSLLAANPLENAVEVEGMPAFSPD